MGAYRAGNVALANAIGNGVADDKAIYAYVPDIHPLLPGRGADPAQRRDLPLLASPTISRYVLEHLPELVVKAVGESGGYGMLMGPVADQRRPRRVPRAPARRPAQLHRAAGRRPVARAVATTPTDAAWSGRHVDLRPYCLYDGERVTIVPGGLTRVALQRGLDGGEFLAGRRQQGHLGAAGETLMLSRIADSLFWIARYMERAEDTARILDVNYHMLLEQSRSRPYRLRWDPLVGISRRAGASSSQRYAEADAADRCSSSWRFSEDNPNSIVQCITKARENARTIRDRISREMWEDINSLYHRGEPLPRRRRRSPPDRIASATLVKFGSHRFHGVSRRHAAARRRLAFPAAPAGRSSARR